MESGLKQSFFALICLVLVFLQTNNSKSNLINFNQKITISVDGIEKKTKNIYLPLTFSSQEFKLINSKNLFKNSRYFTVIEKGSSGEILGVSFSAIHPQKGLPRKVTTVLNINDPGNKLKSLQIDWSKLIFNRRPNLSLGFAGVKELSFKSNLELGENEPEAFSLENKKNQNSTKEVSSFKVLGRTIRESRIKRKSTNKSKQSKDQPKSLLALSSGKLFFYLDLPSILKDLKLRRVYVPLFFRTKSYSLENLIRENSEIKVIVPNQSDWNNKAGFRVIDNRVIEIYSLSQESLPQKIELEVPFKVFIDSKIKNKFEQENLVLKIGDVFDTPVYVIPSDYIQVTIYPNNLKI